MKKMTGAVAVMLAWLLSGCGGADTSSTEIQPPPRHSPSAEESPSEESSPEESPSKQAPSKKASSPAGGAGDQMLIGTVGESQDPEAFTIALTDESGDPVTTLAAGEYQVKVTDPATLHNFHLTGPGVDETTSVSGTGEVTWKVTFEARSYTFICDPHPQMVGQVTVT